MQNEILYKGKMRIQQNDKDRKKKGLCFILVFFFQVVLRLPEKGSSAPRPLRQPRLMALTETAAFSISLQCSQAAAHVEKSVVIAVLRHFFRPKLCLKHHCRNESLCC